METLAKSISQHSPALIALLSLCVILLAAIIAWMWSRLKAMQAKWDMLLSEASGANVERMLEEHFDERRQLIASHDDTKRRVDILEQKMDGAKRHLGIVRYDAFEEVGGAQSFALALFDDRGDGVVVSSLVGRSDCRVYGKALTRGRSERTLSQEEQRAIEEAERVAPRPVIAP